MAEPLEVPPLEGRRWDLVALGEVMLRFDPGFKELSRVEQIWKQNAIDQKTRTVAHDHRQFSNLADERERC